MPRKKQGLGPLAKYTSALADEVCKRMAEGESLNEICRDEHMPTPGTVRGWALDDIEGFYARYARARGLQAEFKFEEMERVALDGSRDYVITKDGQEYVRHEHIARSRLIVDTLKWQASKLLPKIYGDKSVTELTGPGGAPLIPEGGVMQMFALPDNKRDKDDSGSGET